MDTLGHWFQGCPSAHDFRITRHDEVVRFIKNKLDPTYTVFSERVFPTAIGSRKPDLVVVGPNIIYVIDVQISSDANISRLEQPFIRKIQYVTQMNLKTLWFAPSQFHMNLFDFLQYFFHGEDLFINLLTSS